MDKPEALKKIVIKPSWLFSNENGDIIDHRLFILLNAIHQHGKLTIAAKKLKISYRHSWNLINQWTDFFGSNLIELQKGKGATLTVLGQKLLWAEQRVFARFEPQLISIASELNLEIQKQLANPDPILRINASYGYAVALLPDFANQFKLDLQYKTAEDALASLSKGQCDIAGFHLPTNIVSQQLIDEYSQYYKPNTYKVIRFVTRQQGLIIKKDNSKTIKNINDIVAHKLKFINRQKMSGTRILIDEILSREGIDSKNINGYDDIEFTHSAVAAYVASGMADVGIGIETAARQFGLDFISLTTEHYVLVCHSQTLNLPAVQKLITEIKTQAFQQAVLKLAGYQPVNCGDVVDLETMLPW